VRPLSSAGRSIGNVIEFPCWNGICTPELYSVKLDWFEYSSVDEEFVVYKEFGLRPSNQYILVKAIPSCFRLMKMCLCQVSLLSRSCHFLLGGVAHCYMDRGGGTFFFFGVVSVTWIDLNPLAFVVHFFKPVLDFK
jgi:hypothetical protein